MADVGLPGPAVAPRKSGPADERQAIAEALRAARGRVAGLDGAAPTLESRDVDPIGGFDSRPQRALCQRYGWCELRRLYSTFAGSWPGAGLLLMRLVVGSVLLVRAGSKLGTDAPLHATLTSAALAASALLLMAGLWTPLAGAVVAVLQISSLLTTGPDRLVCLLAGTVGGALAMLGPGRWSVDARLFGWKRIEAPSRKTLLERALSPDSSVHPASHR